MWVMNIRPVLVPQKKAKQIPYIHKAIKPSDRMHTYMLSIL